MSDATSTDGMAIAEIELLQVPPRWLFLKITTKNGLVGWGEPVVEGRASTVEAAVNEMRSFLIGHPANKIEDFWQMVYRGGFYRGGPVLMSALSGIDQALWDIKGKALDVPIYELLGGAVRDEIKVYGWIGGETIDDLIEATKRQLVRGFDSVKMVGTEWPMQWLDSPDNVNRAAERVKAVREFVGDKVGIGIDLHGRAHKAMAKQFAKAFEPYQPYFLEEPILSENVDAFQDLHAYTSIPIATGERLYSRWDFKPLFEQNAIDIAQPDASHAGGISEMRRIATMAEAYDVAIAPHCPLGPISLASALQIDFSCHNALIQETSMGANVYGEVDLLDYLVDPSVFDLVDGSIKLTTAPGLGIEVDEDKVREASKVPHEWKSPIWRNADGSVTEW